eukprot:scaffold7688_cov130-Isochrysis_galbana.AAC.21
MAPTAPTAPYVGRAPARGRRRRVDALGVAEADARTLAIENHLAPADGGGAQHERCCMVVEDAHAVVARRGVGGVKVLRPKEKREVGGARGEKGSGYEGADSRGWVLEPGHAHLRWGHCKDSAGQNESHVVVASIEQGEGAAKRKLDTQLGAGCRHRVQRCAPARAHLAQQRRKGGRVHVDESGSRVEEGRLGRLAMGKWQATQAHGVDAQMIQRPWLHGRPLDTWAGCCRRPHSKREGAASRSTDAERKQVGCHPMSDQLVQQSGWEGAHVHGRQVAHAPAAGAGGQERAPPTGHAGANTAWRGPAKAHDPVRRLGEE